MNDENIGIDKSAPVVYPFEIEAGLDALVADIAQVVLEVGTVFTDRIKEEHAGVET